MAGSYEADVTVAVIEFMKQEARFVKLDDIVKAVLGEVTISNRSRIQKHVNGLQVAGAADKLQSSGKKTDLQYRLTGSDEVKTTYRNVSKSQMTNPFSSAPGPQGNTNISYIPRLDIGTDQPSGLPIIVSSTQSVSNVVQPAPVQSAVQASVQTPSNQNLSHLMNVESFQASGNMSSGNMSDGMSNGVNRSMTEMPVNTMNILPFNTSSMNQVGQPVINIPAERSQTAPVTFNPFVTTTVTPTGTQVTNAPYRSSEQLNRPLTMAEVQQTPLQMSTVHQTPLQMNMVQQTPLQSNGMICVPISQFQQSSIQTPLQTPIQMPVQAPAVDYRFIVAQTTQFLQLPYEQQVAYVTAVYNKQITLAASTSEVPQLTLENMIALAQLTPEQKAAQLSSLTNQ